MALETIEQLRQRHDPNNRGFVVFRPAKPGEFGEKSEIPECSLRIDGGPSAATDPLEGYEEWRKANVPAPQQPTLLRLADQLYAMADRVTAIVLPEGKR